MFVLTVNPISSWDLSISHCPAGSSNSVWSNQTHSGVIKLIFFFPTLFRNPLLLTAICLSLEPRFCLSSNLNSQSCFVFYLFYSCLHKSFLLSNISPKSLTQYSRPHHNPIIFSVFPLPTFFMFFTGAKWSCLWFPKHTPYSHTSLLLPSARNAICFCLSKSGLFLRSGSKHHSPVFWSSLKFNEEFIVNYEHCVNKKGNKDNSNTDKCMK